MKRRAQAGTTLIELVIAIVVISTAATTLVGLLAFVSRTSAEGMGEMQSAGIANSYLRRILAEPFGDIDDHHEPTKSAVVDALGNPLAGFDNYRVQVWVLEPGLPNVPAADTKLVRVRVTDPFGDPVELGGFRTRHP